MATKTRSRQRGRREGRVTDITLKGWRDILMRVKDEQKEDNLSIVSAGVAFYAMLSVFPGLAALISIYALFADPSGVQQQIAGISGFIPQESRQLLEQQINHITSTSSGALGAGAIGGLLISLWSANKGMKAFMTALDIVYDEKETRGFFKINGVSLLFTVGGILAVLISLSLIAVIPAILQFLGIPESIRDVVNFGRWPILALMVMLWLAVMYRYAPDRREPGWRWVSWGSAIATVLWIGASFLFSFYVSNFGSYNKTYGSMGAIIILLMWFFLTAYAVLIGAELDAAIEQQAGAETARRRTRSAKERSARSTGGAERKTREKRG